MKSGGTNLSLQLLRFGVVGTVGFLVDASTVVGLTRMVHLGPLPARILSFLVAASVTWKLNRHFTFARTGNNSYQEWGKYLMATALGGMVNVAIYRYWISMAGTTTRDLVIGVALGSLGAMVLNFLIAKKLIFR